MKTAFSQRTVPGSRASLLSMVLGYLFSFGVLSAYSDMTSEVFGSRMEVHFSPAAALMAAALSFVTVLLAAHGPAKQVAKILPIEAVRGEQYTISVCRRKGTMRKCALKKAKNHPFLTRRFGFLGEIAANSVGAGKKLYHTCMVTLSLCMMETVAEKVEQDNAVDYDEKAFEMVGPHAPQKVKDAWMEAAKEVNANGTGIKKNGMMSHISQMMVQRCNKMLRGETDYSDILGSTVESAIRATEKALYDLDHPLAPAHRSIEAEQARIKESIYYGKNIAQES